MIIYNRTEYKALSPQQYTREKKRLQVELLKLQEWVIKQNKRVKQRLTKKTSVLIKNLKKHSKTRKNHKKMSFTARLLPWRPGCR